MNQKNQDLFFNDDNDEVAVITLTDEDGVDIDAEVIAALEINELGKEFIAVMPIEESEDFEEGEAMILEYSEDADGEPVFSPVEEDEFEIVSQVFNQFFEEESEDDDESDDYLDDISDIIPGVSIKKD